MATVVKFSSLGVPVSPRKVVDATPGLRVRTIGPLPGDPSPVGSLPRETPPTHQCRRTRCERQDRIAGRLRERRFVSPGVTPSRPGVWRRTESLGPVNKSDFEEKEKTFYPSVESTLTLPVTGVLWSGPRTVHPPCVPSSVLSDLWIGADSFLSTLGPESGGPHSAGGPRSSEGPRLR